MCTEDLEEVGEANSLSVKLIRCKAVGLDKTNELKYHQIRFECISSIAMLVSPRDTTCFHS